MSRPTSEDPAPETPSQPPDKDLFLEALERLEEVPDKDRLAAKSPPRRKVERRPPDKRLTKAPAALLDLHGLKAEAARASLDRFIRKIHREGERRALVITGKGLRSPGGVAVLKEELERWVKEEGAAFLEAYSEAPRPLGGRGAYVLYIRRT